MRTRHFLIALLAGIAVVLLLARHNWAYLEKVLQELVLPVGFIWVALAVIGLAACRRAGKVGLAILLCWVFYTVSGNTVVGDLLLGSLERRYADTDPLETEPCDVIAVLGGGSSLGLNGTPQLAGDAGNRIWQAAQLYRAGKTKHLLCTGSRIDGLSLGNLEPGSEAAVLLAAMGVPDEHMTIVGGHNTRGEIAAIANWCRARSPERVGLLTSAWHLPRAVRLARAVDLDVVPLPAHFATSTREITLICAIPSVNGFRSVQQGIREYLAWLVDR